MEVTSCALEHGVSIRCEVKQLSMDGHKIDVTKDVEMAMGMSCSWKTGAGGAGRDIRVVLKALRRTSVLPAALTRRGKAKGAWVNGEPRRGGSWVKRDGGGCIAPCVVVVKSSRLAKFGYHQRRYPRHWHAS